MNRIPGRSLNRDRRGGMPFALVAVTILLAASSYCAVAETVSDHGSEAESVSEELEALNSSAESAASFVDLGLGEIIYDICTDPDLGDLDNRCAVFNKRASHWIEFQFPIFSAGITANLEDYSISLSTEKLTLGTESDGLDGYVPSFLKATGKITAVFESEYGTSTRTFDVSTDGSCALPLSVQTGSLFENAVTGGGSALSQLIDYQLTSLAQYRVINGYGALYQYGEKGTSSIITASDVEEAYSNALHALECLYFRDSAGNTYFGSADIAKEFVAENGRITLDLNTVYAQALSAHIDDIVGKWFDYFLGNYVLDLYDAIDDALKDAWDGFVSFITGKKTDYSAAPYIKATVGKIDTSVRTGDTFTFFVPNEETGEMKGYTVDYPSVDLYHAKVIKNFKKTYRSDNNEIREWLYSIVNTAISYAAEGKGMGTVSVDTTDSGTFAETISKAIKESLDDNIASVTTILKKVIKSNKIPDQFYAAIYSTIEDNKDSIFAYGESAFNTQTEKQLLDTIISDFSTEEKTITAEEAKTILADAFLLDENRATVSAYQSEVDALMEKLDSLNRVTSSSTSVIERGCIAIVSGGAFLIDCVSDIENIATAMCQEYEDSINVNPYSGFTEYPEDEVFTLTGDHVYSEKLNIVESSNPTVTVGKASSKSSHETGFEECKYASYCTVFPVTVEDTLAFKVSSAGTLLDLLGLSDSVYADTVKVDISVDISVVSGWGLIGVDYESSTNFVLDVYNTIIDLLEPLLEPLRELMSMAEDIMDKLSQVMMLIEQYVNDLLEEMYEAILEPLEKFKDMVDNRLTRAFCDTLLDVCEKAEAIVDVSAVSQTVGFTYMGFTLKFTFNLSSLEKYTKYLVKAELTGEVDGIDISAFLNIRTKGETTHTPYINAGFTLTGDDWALSSTIDPTMTTNKNLMTLSGTVKGIKIDAVLPEAVQYNEVGIALSDFPGISTILSNIPSPIAGTKVAIDAGVSLKYNFPMETGVLINEFEPNPEGTDKDREWVEIINLSGTSVDLTDWTLTTSKKKVHVIKDVTLAPGERTVIYFTGTFLVNSKEYLILKDPDGTEVDRSTTMGDGANDEKTVQRGMDGCTQWSLSKGTPGEANSGGLFGNGGIAQSVIKDVVKTAAVKAMSELKHVYTTEALEELFVRTVKYAVDDGIDRLSSCLVEGSIYVSADFTDLSGSGHTGFKIYVTVDSDIVGDVLKYLLGKAEALFLNIDDPYNISIDTVLYDDVYFGVAVYGGIKAPKFLSASSTENKVLLEVDIQCNLSALGGLFGMDLGSPKVKAQIGIKNCPYELIPKSLGMKKNMSYDLWFLRMTFSPA